MKDGYCSRFFPKKFQTSTIVDQDGYPLYRRRDNGIVVEKNGISLDNHYVVPYNSQLLVRYYKVHLNIEWCNQSIFIKYINKDCDRITIVIIPPKNVDDSKMQYRDEVKQYLNCKTPTIERLYFHLPGEQSILFGDFENMDSLFSKPTVK
ncbi:hypothetical protein GmHk_15G043787 [Glycine max]|nr:hypothetical protein GmHk_15G043787 [Glycine max]